MAALRYSCFAVTMRTSATATAETTIEIRALDRWYAMGEAAAAYERDNGLRDSFCCGCRELAE